MNELIGRNTDEIEKENEFYWYVEFKSKEMFGFDREEHGKLMETFIEFLPKEDIRILKLNDEVVESVFEVNYEEAVKNIELLKDGEGKFYDGEDEISYSILTSDFFAIIQQGMIFWSSKRDLAEKWSKALTKADLNFHDMSFVGESEDEIRETIDKELSRMSQEELDKAIKEGNENSLWEDKTKINGVWVDDKTGGVL
ncbi:hypothetical protein COU62_02690 [Candidatus Pacearchaeota archaeon CG10_big_fil_rev_8_21_14_0_10_35_219]|nr:hypothetical protein [Candidatus Pacearchaeota archaeon]OIO43324.1 MAG: hypothetical protein AUJ63_00315 [Candidatus Pacearchaeota archaeon CG1_02_35_32]PIO07746.1 MAG: hypothetical protein COU62_02690 [Candidatus Pacearchaeota archaeon CG10_big_fil_rev_8_21_14_0_10_35_219]PIY81472.1 MAG: hypothetical protein COY79_01895 [Candidatus Pacearchaeota archaeon CG_4_10_14_0_8_um_filter_35_169]PIZ80442.1 MAG: hypothetical protein COY00_01225 [Candidatus Pacearchaeota archaeon CG_4_10_14_0_2_um_filt